MAKDKKDIVTPVATVAEVDYSKMSTDELLEEIGKAYAKKDTVLMGKLARLHTKKAGEEEKAKKDALLAELVETTKTVKARITELIDQMVEEGILDGAEGVWYVRDFGEKEEVGINPACRLIKSGKKAGGAGGVSSGKSSYKSGLPSSEEMLKSVGDEVYLTDDTEVTIDKQAQTLPAGMTYREAYDYSTNGGWRNRVRMAVAKKAGLI